MRKVLKCSVSFSAHTGPETTTVSKLFSFPQKKYRTKIETLNFTPVDDRVDYVTAKQSGEILNDVSTYLSKIAQL